jgi:signal transduction histidine kinase
MTGLKTRNGGTEIYGEDITAARAALMLKRARLMGILTLILLPLFGVSDWIDYRSSFPLWVRLIATLLVLGAYLIGMTDWGSRRPFFLVFACTIFVPASLALIMWRQNDVKDSQDGFVILILGVCGLLPARTAHAAFLCAIILSLFFGTGVYTYGSAVISKLGPDIIVLLSVTAFCLIIRDVANKLWEREFELRAAIKELRATQMQLIETEKMAALGRLVAGVAHEMNNSLTVIASNLSPLERAVKSLLDARNERDDQDSADGDAGATRTNVAYSLKMLHSGIERAASITQNLKKYSSRSQGQHSTSDVNGIVESSISLISTKAKEKDVTIHREYGSVPPVKADPQGLGQVLVNVLINAFDAVPESGNIWVRTAALTGTDHLSGATANQSGVLITVNDDGPGIDPQNLSRLFEPFFTTKPPGAGMGLGLGIARRIVENHNGTIEIANDTRGTVVSIKLPADGGSLTGPRS